MDTMMIGCVYLMLFYTQTTFASYRIPDVMFQAFIYEKGLRAWIPDNTGITKFSFHANINKPIKMGDRGKIFGDVEETIKKKWIVADTSVNIKIGDVINYYVEVTVNEANNIVVYKKERGYTVTEETFKACKFPATILSNGKSCLNVTDLRDNLQQNDLQLGQVQQRISSYSEICKPSATMLRKGKACSGETIFRDDFNEIDPELWQLQQYIPFYSTEFPFVSYQSLASDKPTVSIDGGRLRIIVKLQQNEKGFDEDSIYNGTLNLIEGCTSFPESCKVEAWGASILPPIVTGRITSKFAFTYGIVNVKAKLPQGDWLYPEILLEPFLKKYGSFNYRSGVIRIASALGNNMLHNSFLTDYSNTVLFGGPIIDFQCRDVLLRRKALKSRKKWSNDFHVYSLRWEPDRISLSVDGEEWLLLEPNNTLMDLLPSKCEEAHRTSLDSSNKMAPFDEHFQLTLGMGAGSITEFPDDLIKVGGHIKPWANGSRKAMLNFWKAKEIWLQTWNQPQLLVDYVEVIAL